MPPQEEMMRRNLEEVKAWLAPQLGGGALEVAIVGDVDIEAAIAAAARTIGALPPRGPKPELLELKQVKFPPSRSRKITRSNPRSRKARCNSTGRATTAWKSAAIAGSPCSA
jgi:zinc protease